MRLANVLCVAAILSAPAVLCAQSAEQDSVRSAMIQMKSDLRNLVVAQEAYYSEHSAYAADIDNLKFRHSAGVTITLTATQNNAWAAEAHSALIPAWVCGIYINLAEQYRPKVSLQTKAAEGQPACMNPSEKP
jgi:Tfp pilus assembly protein PilE